MNKQNIVFTDLDGTLLEHSTYSFEDAVPMLKFLKINNIPLIIATSKTKNEVIKLQKMLDINHPFIVENGGGIFIHKSNGYDCIPLGFSYQKILNFFDCYSKKFDILGFSQMDTKEIISYTGLDEKSATFSKQRDFTEPFLLNNKNQLTDLKATANKDGLDIVKGGRFYHLISKGQSKANAMKKVLEIFTKRDNKNYISIALGDSLNDVSMLKDADIPIVIPRIDGSHLELNIENLTFASFPGPKGWNKTLKEYFHAK
jgi:mannosyl-3-phosphoglycerate phosphatase